MEKDPEQLQFELKEKPDPNQLTLPFAEVENKTELKKEENEAHRMGE